MGYLFFCSAVILIIFGTIGFYAYDVGVFIHFLGIIAMIVVILWFIKSNVHRKINLKSSF